MQSHVPARWRAGAVEERLHEFKCIKKPDTCAHGCSCAIVLKAAASIRDEVFNVAEHAASAMVISRSQLYSRAAEEFVSRHSCKHMTERLDAVYESAVSTSSLNAGLNIFNSCPCQAMTIRDAACIVRLPRPPPRIR